MDGTNASALGVLTAISAFHRACFRCHICRGVMGAGYGSHDGKFYCSAHYRQAYQGLTSSQTTPASYAPSTEAPTAHAITDPALPQRANKATSYSTPPRSNPLRSGSNIVFRREASAPPEPTTREASFGVALLELTRRHGVNLPSVFAKMLAAISTSTLRGNSTWHPLSFLRVLLLPHDVAIL